MGTDEELITLCRRRDAGAWEELIRRYQPAICRLAYQFTGDEEEARDLAQANGNRSFCGPDPARSALHRGIGLADQGWGSNRGRMVGGGPAYRGRSPVSALPGAAQARPP